MSFEDSYDAKERVKQAVDIVDLVGGYLQLRREGRAFKALCPWHDDTRPSLTVNPERQSFRCWVCDIGGDIFSFVMRIEGVEFPEALAMLADRANIALKPSASAGSASSGAENKRLLYQAMDWADEQYHRLLLEDPRAAAARDYLAERQVTDESVRRFQLGFAPDDWNWICERAAGTPYSPAVLERIGLISRRRQGTGYYDRFRGRILFPIFDSQNRSVGIGGRVLPGAADNGKDVAKYVNSPETPLFAKSTLLYGLNLARDAIRKTGTALVVEGYTDCIAAHQFGFEQTVAVLGTALGPGHIQLLRRHADRIRVVLVLDGDEAGRRRASEVLELFVSANVDLRVLTLPANSDPADFLQTHGADAFGRLVESSADALTHAFHAATEGIDLQADLHAASASLQKLVATIAKAPRLRADTMLEDRLREEKFLQRLASDFRVPESQVRGLLTKLRRKASERTSTAGAERVASVRQKIDPLDRELLELLLQTPQAIEQVASVIQPAQLVGDACRRVFSHCTRLWAAGILPRFERLLLEIDDEAIKNLLVELDESGQQKPPPESAARLNDVLAAFAQRPKDEWLRDRTRDLQQQKIAKEDEAGVLKELEEYLRARDQQKEQRSRLGISELTEGQDAPSAG